MVIGPDAWTVRLNRAIKQLIEAARKTALAKGSYERTESFRKLYRAVHQLKQVIREEAH